MTGILQGNLAAGCLFSVVEHSPPYLKEHVLKLCLLEESNNPALLLPGCHNYSISNFPTVSFKECVTTSCKVRKATCEHTAHTSAFKRRQNHSHSHRKLHRKSEIPKDKEV